MQTKPLLLIALFLAILPTAFGQISPFMFPSESELLSHSSSATCANFNCSDNQLTTTDIYTSIRDGSTSTLNRIQHLAVRQAISVSYDLPEGEPRQGTYYFRVYFQDTGTFNFLLVPYTNHTYVSYSNAVYLPLTISSQDWYDIDVTSVVSLSSTTLPDNRAKFRLVIAENSSSTIMDVGEAYLLQPPTREDLQIISQGVAETALNTYVINEWKLLSIADVSVSSYGCTLTNASDLGTQSIPTFSTTFDNTDNTLQTIWYSNGSYLLERKNYEVDCFMVINGANITGIKQFVYINADKSVLDYILLFVQKIAQIIGLLEQNQGLLNLSLQNENQTRIQIANLSQQLSATNQSIIDAIETINVTATANLSGIATQQDILDVKQNLSDQLQDIRDYLVFGEAYS